MFLKKIMMPAVVALAATFGTTTVNAATCDVSCVVSGADGQLLSDGVGFQIDQIVEGAFTFTGNFVNDTDFNSGATTAVLTFTMPPFVNNLAHITDLFLNIIGSAPVGVPAQSIRITNADGSAVNLDAGNAVRTSLVLTGGGNPATIDFTLTGTAVASKFGALPNIDFQVSPVPLPAGVLLMGTALAGFGVMRRRKKAA